MANTSLTPPVANHSNRTFKLIGSATASTTATVDFEDLDSTYAAYLLVGSKVLPATSVVDCYLRVGTGVGPTYQSGASDYAWHGFGKRNGTASSSQESTAASAFSFNLDGFNIGNASTEGCSFAIMIYDPSSTNSQTHMDARVVARTDANLDFWVKTGGYYLSTTAVTAIRFLFSSGNIASGEFRLYGLKDS